MPLANLYLSTPDLSEEVKLILPELRAEIARQLSGASRKLLPAEVSVRLLLSDSKCAIAPVEMEVTAQNYSERAARADEICLGLRSFMQRLLPAALDIRVWLKLVELGHSWDEEEIRELHRLS